jgi:NAD(P)H-hydrate repair Nnr-like enzyme with NAD(P)H-hydrate epimerase domain
MERAGTAAAKEIERRYVERLRDGAVVFTGPGNNGGDGWVVAANLARSGIQVSVIEVVRTQEKSRTPSPSEKERLLVKLADSAPNTRLSSTRCSAPFRRATRPPDAI